MVKIKTPNLFNQGEEREKEVLLVNNQDLCKNCNKKNTCVKVALPYVLRYLTNELAAMNIKLSFSLTSN